MAKVKNRWSIALLLFSMLVFFEGCASVSTPSETTQRYLEALHQEDAAKLYALYTPKEQANLKSDDVFRIALRQSAKMKGQAHFTSRQSDTMEAKVQKGGHLFLLEKIGDAWRIRCTSAMPYHNQTPMATLIYIHHLIRSEDYQTLGSLSVSKREALVKPSGISDYQTLLARFLKETEPLICTPFTMEGDVASLTYGEFLKKSVRLKKTPTGFRIVDLW